MKTRILVSALATLILAGCSAAVDTKEQASVGRLACKTHAKVDTASLKIEGEAVAEPGAPVRYELNQDVACAQDKSVTWTSMSGNALSASDDSAFVSQYRKPGEYVVKAEILSAGDPVAKEISYKTVVTPGLAINGPIIGMVELEHHFEVAVPTGVRITGVSWNMGDGSPAQFSGGQIDHTYWRAGDFVVTATVNLEGGDQSVVTHNIKVIPAVDGMECVRDLALSGPSVVNAGSPLSMSLFIPQCMSWRVRAIRWNFGDGSPQVGSQSVTHTYQTAGTYTVTVQLFQAEATTPFLTITRVITVNAASPVPEDPEDPGPTNPHLCTTEGATRKSASELYTEELECGIGGKKIMSYRDRVVETCRLQGEVRRWVETSRTKELLNEGQCLGVACELPPEALQGVDASTLNLLVVNGRYYLSDGASKTFYSSQRPNGTCSEVAEVRTCDDGTLGGSTTHKYLFCLNGCPGVGPDGTTVTVVTGEEQVVKSCQYGETGIFDLFNQVSDRTCENGQVTTRNVRRGTVKTEGQCPTYGWAATENYTACTKDCGGEQTLIHECRSSQGSLAPAERCQGEAPVVTRVCSGNPEAVRRSEASTVIEEVGSSATCPKNQIGRILQRREVTTTNVYACINHAVQLESTNVTNGPWVEERQCREYVPWRCSHDSLSNTQANGRLRWMLKCRDQVPAIDAFLDQFESSIVGSDNSVQIVVNGRNVYPTLMDSETNKPWIAPRSVKGTCDVPASVYVAAVCVASCATPEQNILAQAQANGKLQYVPFVKAWQEQFQMVATLASQSSMSSKFVQKTAVDNWVTEMVDSEHDILVFNMKSGGQLRITPNHPLVTDQGSMRYASDFKVGENLVRHGGERDPIVSIQKVQYFGKVYNVFVKSNELHKNVVLTNGYLNGTAYFQNDGAQHLNRRILRGHLLKGVLEK